MGTSLEDMVAKESKNLVISDLHVPYHDDSAVNCMFKYAKDYKPTRVVINGDLIDFYSLSDFDKCPERKDNITDEIYKSREFLSKLRKVVGKDARIDFLHGNHENRLQKYMWRNRELYGLDSLELKNLLDLKKYNIKEVQADRDYWSKLMGEVKVGDTTIMHGDGRLNRARSSANPGYSAFNTMRNRIGESVIIGHTHRMAQVYNLIGNKSQVGIEGGCLCQHTRENWQQGFVTFESYRGKSFNYRLHPINSGKLVENGKVYKGE
ncbi:MAG: metallophosphoesterase family protein [Promethearchaeota archaeon]